MGGWSRRVDEAGGRREYRHPVEDAERAELEAEQAAKRRERERIASKPAARTVEERLRRRGVVR